MSRIATFILEIIVNELKRCDGGSESQNFMPVALTFANNVFRNPPYR
jgi:hypothetical protein